MGKFRDKLKSKYQRIKRWWSPNDNSEITNVHQDNSQQTPSPKEFSKKRRWIKTYLLALAVLISSLVTEVSPAKASQNPDEVETAISRGMLNSSVHTLTPYTKLIPEVTEENAVISGVSNSSITIDNRINKLQRYKLDAAKSTRVQLGDTILILTKPPLDEIENNDDYYNYYL